MRILLFILLFPALANSQGRVDSVVVVNNNGDTIRYTTTTSMSVYAEGDSVYGRSTVSKKRVLVSPMQFPISTAVAAALALKLVAADIVGKANLSGASFTGSFGYGTGAGGTVTQNANKTTGVTINKQSGQITMNNAALAAAAEVSFVVTNSVVASTDVVIVNVQSVGTAGAYLVSVGAVSNGSFAVTLSNASAGSLSQAVVLNFCIIKSSSN